MSIVCVRTSTALIASLADGGIVLLKSIQEKECLFTSFLQEKGKFPTFL